MKKLKKASLFTERFFFYAMLYDLYIIMMKGFILIIHNRYSTIIFLCLLHHAPNRTINDSCTISCFFRLHHTFLFHDHSHLYHTFLFPLIYFPVIVSQKEISIHKIKYNKHIFQNFSYLTKKSILTKLNQTKLNR